MTVLENVATVEPWMRPFPPLEDVFENVAPDIRELYLPALSIEARIVNPDWTGWLHVVMPVEPFDGGLGEYGAEQRHNHYCRHNLIAFKRTKNGRYEPLADPMFFTINCARKKRGLFLTEPSLDARATLSEAEDFYARVHRSFADARDRFGKPGEFKDIIGHPAVWLYQLGGEPHSSALQDFPGGRPVSPDGRAFAFVGRVTTDTFRDYGPNGFYMFYDPVDEIVWFSLVFQ
jgi:hypothetical protein